MSKIYLRWLGHACFKVSFGDYSLVIDPFKPGTVAGLADINEVADMVLCSHTHGDHSAVEAVKIRQGTQNPFTVTAIKSYHDDAKGAQRGENIIHILEAGGIRIAHFGDIGCALSQQEIEKIGKLNAAMIPVGGFYTIDAVQAKELADRLDVDVVIPMHYRGEDFGPDVIDTVDKYTDLCGNVVYKDTNEISIGADMGKQTVVLGGLK